MGRYKRQHIKRGRHSVNFWDRYFTPVVNRNFTLKGYMYGPGMRYDYGGADNLDWNKYAGIQLDKYQPHGRTIMVAFRYDQYYGRMEWAFYYHHIERGLGEYRVVGKVPGLVDETNIVYTPIGSVPDWEVKFLNSSQIEVKMTYQQKVVSDLVTFKPFGRTHTRGNFYWGGNMPAQDEIEVRKKYSYE